MPVGVLTLEIQIPYAHSLKDKRMVLRKMRDRLRARFNVAVAELDHQDVWQRATLGVVSISDSQKLLESVFHQVLAEAEAVHDIVRLSGRMPPFAGSVGAWRTAWAHLLHGAGSLVGRQAASTATRERRKTG